MIRHAKHINPNPEGTIPSGIDAERLVHSIPLGILVFDLNATLLYANANAEDTLGRPWADLSGDR
ncbi:MAG: PAS domain-containing protein [Synechococcales cyanobacterium T60_A2020_003]|nr:PAS domain-containing protein [Synechococcales cyanobacterium T60_A2020_003]